MISKSELLEQLHEKDIMLDWCDARISELNAIIDRKDAIIDAVVFKDTKKLNNLKDFNTYDEFMKSIFDKPITKTANC